MLFLTVTTASADETDANTNTENTNPVITQQVDG